MSVVPVPFQLTVSSFGFSSSGQKGLGNSCWPLTSEKRAVEVSTASWEMRVTSPNREEKKHELNVMVNLTVLMNMLK